jgi:hypothetical protein
MNEPVPSAFVLRETMRGATDEFLRRPLWEFKPIERRAVLAERAKRWGVPDAENDFDPEYH